MQVKEIHRQIYIFLLKQFCNWDYTPTTNNFENKGSPEDFEEH